MKITKYFLAFLLVVGLNACAHKAKQADADAAAAANAKAQADAAAAAKAAEAMKSAKDANVTDIQEALNKAGASIKVDGKMGKGTHKALREYQKKNKLKVTGKADEATLKSLGFK